MKHTRRRRSCRGRGHDELVRASRGATAHDPQHPATLYEKRFTSRCHCNAECSICLEPFADNEPILAHRASNHALHCFHAACIRGQDRCPLCRSPLRDPLRDPLRAPPRTPVGASPTPRAPPALPSVCQIVQSMLRLPPEPMDGSLFDLYERKNVVLSYYLLLFPTVAAALRRYYARHAVTDQDRDTWSRMKPEMEQVARQCPALIEPHMHARIAEFDQRMSLPEPPRRGPTARP